MINGITNGPSMNEMSHFGYYKIARIASARLSNSSYHQKHRRSIGVSIRILLRFGKNRIRNQSKSSAGPINFL